MPRRSLSFRASQGGLPVPGGLSCPVCLAPEGCPVLCLCLAPEGSWYPLTSPGKFFLGVERVPAVGAGPRGPRPRPQAPPAMASWAPCTTMASWAPCTAMASWAPCTTMASWAPSFAMASFVCSALEVPVLCSCPCLSWGASGAPTPPPRWNCYGVGHAFWEGGVMSVLCRVCHVFLPHVSIFGLFPVLVKCHYELILVQLCLSRYLWFTCVFIVLSIQFDFVWSTRYSRCFLSVSLALSYLVLIKDCNLSLRPRRRVLVPPCCVHRDTY